MNDIDITGRISLFREAARHAWNTYFVRQNFGACLELHTSYGRIETGFFEALVLQPLGMMEYVEQFRSGPLEWLLMVPKDGMLQVPVRFERTQDDGNTYWSDINMIPVSDGGDFLFVEFFDWDWRGYIDMSRVRAQLRGCDRPNNSVSSFVLLDVEDFRFVFRSCSKEFAPDMDAV
jgi:hypothetical protein